MSQRRVGPGQLPVDEGPASAAVSDPMAVYGRLSAAGIPDPLGFGGEIVPTGGAGPVERRTATPEELAAARARDVAPSPLAPRHPWKTPKPSPAAVPSRDQRVDKPVETPAHKMTTEVPTEPVEPIADTLAALRDAAIEAFHAFDELVASEHLADQAKLRWTGARAALDAAYRALDDPPPAIVESAADHSESIPEPVREPTAQGGRATAGQLQQSRRNGQAAMQAQRGHNQKAGQQANVERVIAAMRERRSVTATAIALDISDARVRQLLDVANKAGTLPADVEALIKRRTGRKAAAS